MMQYEEASEAVVSVIVLLLHAGNNRNTGATHYAKRAEAQTRHMPSLSQDLVLSLS
jgi:hypothetical protein